MHDRAESINLIKKSIIRKLYSAGCWGKGHMLFNRLKSGLPAHLRGDVSSAVKNLVKDGLVIVYGRTKYGLAVYLSIGKKKEIEDIIDKL